MCKCNFLFSDFNWDSLTTANKLPPTPGVYAIRVTERGKSINRIISDIRNFLKKINWNPLNEYVLDRIYRLREINQCPIVYIGSTKSLQGRYDDLCGKRHTAFFSIFALLVANWKLEIGWIPKSDYRDEEERLKTEYEKIHGKLPAIVER
jgi:hypothetical protein